MTTKRLFRILVNANLVLLLGLFTLVPIIEPLPYRDTPIFSNPRPINPPVFGPPPGPPLLLK